MNKRPNCLIVIKLTVPTGYTQKIRVRLLSANIYFSPEFLREGRSFQDITRPDRIIVSPKSADTNHIMNLLSSGQRSNNYLCSYIKGGAEYKLKSQNNTIKYFELICYNHTPFFIYVKTLWMLLVINVYR